MADHVVTVDHNRCVGSTMCVQAAGAVFALDDGGQSIVLDAGATDLDTIVEAAAECPMEAITVVDATGTQVFP